MSLATHDLIRQVESLINESPIDNANLAQTRLHIEELVQEEVQEARQGVVQTNKKYLTFRICLLYTSPSPRDRG